MIFGDAFRHYRENLNTVIAFALLLVFVVFFAQFQGSFITSGSIFLDYGLLKAHFTGFLLLVAAVVIFLFFYSVLDVLLVFAVRRDLSKVKVNYYLSEKIQRFALKLFVFFTIMFLALFLLCAALLNLGVPLLAVNAVLLVLSLAFLFLPQSIVIDEESLGSSIFSNFEFIIKHFGSFLLVAVVGSVLCIIIPLAEFVLDRLFLPGRFISILFVLLVVVPYMEVLKTVLYMHKFDLVKEAHKRIKPRQLPKKHGAEKFATIKKLG